MIVRYLIPAVVLGLLIGMLVLPVPASAKCKSYGPLVQPGDGREGRCITTSDGAYEPYTDGRRQRPGASWQRYRESIRAQETERGRRHTSDMASGGTRTSSGIVVSPFVPGSDADRGWQAERKRRGLCGNDRLCLNAN